MTFQFATATKIIFGEGKSATVGEEVAKLGKRVLVVTGASHGRIAHLLDKLDEAQIMREMFIINGEPTIECARDGVALMAAFGADVVLSIGGGSVIDSGKALAALAANPGDPLDYLEVIGAGKALSNPSLPFVAVPTTAGTGAEVTKNAVLASTEHRAKVSLRSDYMLADVALVDPELTYGLPPELTATTGMDALTQVIEPYVSVLANPLTDAISAAGIQRGARAIRRAYDDGSDHAARHDMALTSLLGGLALANAKLGAVHGFAGVLGGMYDAPHGAICARLLPFCTEANIAALGRRDPHNPLLAKYQQVAAWLTGDESARAEDAVTALMALSEYLKIPPLEAYGVKSDDFDTIIDKSKNSSSMKGNSLVLTEDELGAILAKAT